MPAGCKTVEKRVPEHVAQGRLKYLPWCVEHQRWFAECQCRGALVEITARAVRVPRPLPEGVVDFTVERLKRIELNKKRI